MKLFLIVSCLCAIWCGAARATLVPNNLSLQRQSTVRKIITEGKGLRKLRQSIADGALHPDARLSGGDTMLIVAAEAGNLGMVKSLLSAGADPHLKNNSSKTALDYARNTSNKDMIFVLEQAQKQ